MLSQRFAPSVRTLKAGFRARGALAAGLFALGGLTQGCGGGSSGMAPFPPEDVAGTYSVNVTNSSNQCEFANWDGNTTSNLTFQITQSDADATGTVTGQGSALVLGALLGSNDFTGTVSENEVVLVKHGTNQLQTNPPSNCRYTVTATIRGTLDGDFLKGTVTYKPETNGDPDCGVLNSCSSVQNFNGSRPPPN